MTDQWCDAFLYFWSSITYFKMLSKFYRYNKFSIALIFAKFRKSFPNNWFTVFHLAMLVSFAKTAKFSPTLFKHHQFVTGTKMNVSSSGQEVANEVWHPATYRPQFGNIVGNKSNETIRQTGFCLLCLEQSVAWGYETAWESSVFIYLQYA